MSSFTNALILQDTGDGKHWLLHDDIEYHVGEESSGVFVPAQKGEKSDLFSIWIWRTGTGNAAALIHDLLYRRGVVHLRSPGGHVNIHKIGRHAADKIFFEALGVLGVNKVRRVVLYLGVRLFGGWGWRRSQAKRDAYFNQFKEDQGA